MSTPHILKISRLEGLYDGIFSIAMTILILDLKLPSHIGADKLPTLLATAVLGKLYVYIGSFIILGTLWVAMNFQLGLLERVNRPYLWTNVFYLMIICVVPFSASLVGSFPTSPSSIIFYALNLLCASFAQAFVCQCAYYYDLNSDVYTSAIRWAVLRRIAVAPAFYLLSIFLSYVDIRLAFITLVAPTIIYLIPGRVDKFN